MSELTTILEFLPANGTRLKNGLALRLTTGNGMAVLGCNRMGAAPDETEMQHLQDAVWQVVAPLILLQADQTEFRFSDGYEPGIRR